MRVLGLIPARGGSKGVPGKNIRSLGGKPLLQWTAEAALAARTLSKVVLSTDDDGIANVGRSCGLTVPFRRPTELAADDTPTLDVIRHAIGALDELHPAAPGVTARTTTTRGANCRRPSILCLDIRPAF